MHVPETFRVGLPTPFARQVMGWITSAGQREMSGLDGEWVRVSGAPLPVPVLVRIDRASDGRFMVTGLLIGHRDRREITWETLRQIKPATILSLIFSGWDPNNPAQLYADTDPAPPEVMDSEDFDPDVFFADDAEDEGQHIDIRSPEWRTHVRAMAALELWRRTSGSVAGAETAQGVAPTPVTKPRASVATNLTEFAEVYRRHFAANARRATTATAEELFISRATAIRRIDECRRMGLLPPKEEKP